jgi:hypothetical protein
MRQNLMRLVNRSQRLRGGLTKRRNTTKLQASENVTQYDCAGTDLLGRRHSI